MTFTPVTRHQMSSVSSNLRQNPSRGEVGDDLSYLDILCCCRGGHGSCHAQSDPLHPVTHHRSQTFRNVHIPHLYEVIWEECAADGEEIGNSADSADSAPLPALWPL